MKKILTVWLLLSGTICVAQNELFSRQYFLNNYLMNPAVGGVNDYADVRASYSRQWTAIEHSPTSMLLTFHTNLAKEKDQVLRYSPFEKKFAVSKGRLDYYNRRIKHGIGAKIIYDKVNVFTYTDATVSYAAHVPLTATWTLSVGVGGGLSLSAMDLSDHYVPDLSDPVLNNGKRNETVPLVEAGAWLYSTGPYIGASLTRYMEDPYDEDKKVRYMNIYATAGWQLQTNQFVLVPSVMYKHDGYSGGSINLNAMLWFSDIAWAGASLRNLEHPSVHVGLLWRNTLELNYTYDINKSEWGASHEIGIAYRIWNRADDCKNKWYFK